MKKNYTFLKKIAIVGLLIISGLNSNKLFSQCSNIVLTPYSGDSWCPGTCTGYATTGFSGQSSTGPWTFEWSEGTKNQSITGLCGGTYTLTFTDGGYTNCTKTTTATIAEPSAFSIGMSHTNTTGCSKFTGTATASATGGTGTISYAWSTGATTAAITGLIAATYTVVVTDSRGCASSTTVDITCPSGINNNTSNNSLSVYPNPANNTLNIETEGLVSGKTTIYVSNMLGVNVLQYNESNFNGVLKKQIDVSSLPMGMYFIAIENDNKKTVKTFVKGK